MGFRFAPRIRDLPDKRLYIPGDAQRYPTLAGLVGGRLNVKQIRAQWDEVLRLAASIQQGTVTASLMLRKLGNYPRQNGLAVALRELGRIERTLFTLDWLQNVELRRQVQSRLNKGEAKNALARAVFFNRLGELRDRRFENQRYRASGLNLVVAAIVLWNTTYLERAIAATDGTRPRRGRRTAAAPVAARVGTYQPDRRLPLAAKQTSRPRQVPVAQTVRCPVAYDFVPFVRGPRICAGVARSGVLDERGIAFLPHREYLRDSRLTGRCNESVSQAPGAQAARVMPAGPPVARGRRW